MIDAKQTADFLAWAGEIPFLVHWDPGSAGIGRLTFQVADSDFSTAWAQKPESRTLRVAVAEQVGLQAYADQLAAIMQQAHLAETAYNQAT